MKLEKPDFKRVKELTRSANGLYESARYVVLDVLRQEKELENEKEKVQGLKALDTLENVSVEELKNSKAGIRVQALKDAGYENLLQIAKLKDWELVAIDGIGEKQAEAIRNVITEFLNGVAKHSGIRLSARKAPDGTVPQEGLILALMRLRMGEELRQGMTEDLEKLKDGLVEGGERIEIRNGLHWLVAPKDSKERTVKAVKDLEGFIAGDLCQDTIRRVREYRELSEVTPEEALEDFQKHGADYYALMEAHGGSTLEKPLIYSSIPAQLAEAIDGMEIDLRCFKGNLRSYQLFGAKYVLFERRVLLGDEMGLGKTVQAVAAMCDVYARDPQSLFLVVCPASVLINWCREVEKFSTMPAYLLHGPYVESNFMVWKEGGGVAVTNFETMSKIVSKIDGRLKLGMLVIDEAHYVKNPDAQRTQNVRRLEDEAERILLMTGTPLENRVEEMCSLIEFVRPDMVDEVRKNAFLSHAPEFRQILAPVYLRRQREQVLKELPPIEEMQEWCALTGEDREEYARAVTERSFPSMRRVAFLQTDLGTSSKAVRLLELCRDAMEDDRKIVIYSFFRETIEKVKNLLGERCIGVITGSTEITERQGIIDLLADAPAGSAIVCQIQAGGTGLNVQAASVAIFCEPQIKPSLTNQAIARIYRMGQVRNVLAYHLLCENTVDEAMVKLLEAKQREFDAYADESVLADALDALVDKDWIQRIIEEENQKYAGED